MNTSIWTGGQATVFPADPVMTVSALSTRVTIDGADEMVCMAEPPFGSNCSFAVVVQAATGSPIYTTGSAGGAHAAGAAPTQPLRSGRVGYCWRCSRSTDRPGPCRE